MSAVAGRPQSIKERTIQLAAEIAADKYAVPSLWPDKYSADTPEAMLAFIFDHCKTWDEASAVERTIPRHAYLEEIGREWFATMKSGQPLVIEKSRRLVVSWFLCAADVWDAGRRRCNIVQGGIDYDKASDFVYRCWYIYTRLPKEWKLPPPSTWGNVLSQRLDKLADANGSVLEPLNSDGESFRGSGYTRVKLEELSAYRYIGTVFSQAVAVTQGPPGTTGGHVIAVCNARATPEWQELKKLPEGQVAEESDIPGYEAYTAASGVRVLRIHYSADPQKDQAWVDRERAKGWSEADWQLEMELNDKQAAGALWKFEQFNEDMRARKLPELVSIAIGLDPAVTDPKKKKNPSKPPDDTGIIAVGLTNINTAIVLSDLSGVFSPNEWARLTVGAYSRLKANVVAAEVNQGGQMVADTIHTIGPFVHVVQLHASRGKRARAEPVAALYEQGRVLHYWPEGHQGNPLRKLEAEMCSWDSTDPTEPSPGRIDGLVWAFHALGLCQATGSHVHSFMKKKQEEDYD